MEHCAECGFDYRSVQAGELPGRLRGAAGRYPAALHRVDDPRQRPRPDVWSALEYACHVRDVLLVQRDRLALARRVDEPEFSPMSREELVVSRAYNAQEPATVLEELAAAADELAAAFGSLRAEEWERTGVYNWPVRQARTMRWLGRHTLHELEHHLLDISRG